MTDKPTPKPEPKDADRERAGELNMHLGWAQNPSTKKFDIDVERIAAELAAVREEAHTETKKGYIQQLSRLEQRIGDLLSPGPCGKHPKVVYQLPNIKHHKTGEPLKTKFCPVCKEIKTACESEKERMRPLLVEACKNLRNSIRCNAPSHALYIDINAIFAALESAGHKEEK